jgi:CheY-like chemotaxis protein
MHILIVEDDYIQASSLQEALRQALGREGRKIDIDRIATEERFRAKLGEIARDKPDVIIMDVMLRWTDAAEPLPEAPEEVRREGYHRAGIRCQRLLAENPETRNIPVIFYTVLEESDLKPELEDLVGNFVYLSKNSSVAPLVEEIRRRTRSRPEGGHMPPP